MLILPMKKRKLFKNANFLKLSAVCLLAGLFGSVSYVPSWAQSDADVSSTEQLEEKDLLIRNLRRTVFDLESQLSGTADDSRDDTIRQLRKQLKEQRDALTQEHSSQISDLQQSVSQLRRQIQTLEKEKQAVLSEQNSTQHAKLNELDRQLREKTEQLNSANELVAKIVQERTDTDDKLTATTGELKEKIKAFQELEDKYSDIKTKQDKAIEKAEKPFKEKIAELEKNIKDVREQALSNEEKAAIEKESQKKKYEDEIRGLLQKVKDLEETLSKKDNDVSAADKKNQELTATVKDKEERLAAQQKKIDGHDEEMRDEKKKYEQDLEAITMRLQEKEENLASSLAGSEKLTGELNGMKKQVLEKEDKIIALTKESRDAAAPYAEKITALEKQMNEKDLVLKMKEDEAVQFQAKIQDHQEKADVYKKLVDKQEFELTELRKNLEQRQGDVSKLIEEGKQPLQQRIAELEEQAAGFDQALTEERFKAKNEMKAQLDQTSAELSKAKIDGEYKQARLDQLNKEKLELETQWQATAQKNDELTASVEALNKVKDDHAFPAGELEALKTNNAELNERLEILLHENAEYQKKMTEFATQLEGSADAKETAAELKKAEHLIQGFKKDVDAKTIEISGLSDENHDLRVKLKQSIRDVEVLNQELAKLSNRPQSGLSREDQAKMEEQMDSLKTALSKARQLIAQKDVELEDLKKDRDLLRNDIVSLTDQLNLKIQQIGELDYASRNAEDLYTETDMDKMKTPLLDEIARLKSRVAELEQQVVDNWNRAESMLLELKNHPTIKQAESQADFSELDRVR